MSRRPAMTSLLSGHAAKIAFGSTRVTSSRGSARFRKRAAVAPANPPPITTMRGCAPWAMSGRGNNDAPAPARAAATNWRRLERVAVMTASALRVEPGRDGLDLVIGEALGDAVHHGRGSPAGPKRLHGRHHGARLLPGEPRHRRIHVRFRSMASGAR